MRTKIMIVSGAALLFVILIFVLSTQNTHNTNTLPSQPTTAPPTAGDSPRNNQLPASEFTEPTSPPGVTPTSLLPQEGDVVIADETTMPPEGVDFAPDFTLPRIDGKGASITLSDYRGVKPVILDFFAPHCPNCRRNIKTQVPLYEKYKERVEIIVLAIDPPKANQKYFDENPVPMPVVYDASEQALRDYKVRFTNTHVLIAKDGSLVENLSSVDIIEEDFNRLLQ